MSEREIVRSFMEVEFDAVIEARLSGDEERFRLKKERFLSRWDFGLEAEHMRGNMHTLMRLSWEGE